MTNPLDPAAFSTAQQAAYDVSRGDRARSLDAIQLLEAMVGRPAPGRDSDWQADVVNALRYLEKALRQQRDTYEDPTSLLADIAHQHPRLRTWVRQLHRQWSQLARDAESLREQLDRTDDVTWNYADVREELRGLLTALRHHRAREADLIFEALSTDIGAGD
jgi:hypothetical protein